MSQFTPEDWIAAGYKRFEANPIIDAEAVFLLERIIYDEDGVTIRYHIHVKVFDHSKYNINQKWGIVPFVQFRNHITTDISLHTDDPKAAEAQFELLWNAMGKPYYS